MKVWLFTNISFPYGFAPANRLICYAKSLQCAGLECEVIIYRRTERFGAPTVNKEGVGTYEGVPFRYISGTPMRGSNVLKRAWNDFGDRIAAILFLKTHLNKNDVVWEYAGFDVSFQIRICKLLHRLGAKYVMELCELPFGTKRETAYSIRKRKVTERRWIPIVDGIVPISEALKQYASKFAKPDCIIQKVPILVDFDKYDLEDRSMTQDTPYIFHCGSLTEQKDGILGMIEAFGIAVNKMAGPLKFFCTGKRENSQYAGQIDELVSKYNLQDKLVFLGNLDEIQLREYLSGSILVVINKKSTQQNRYCFPTKLGEYMAAGKPVITTNFGEPMNWLEDGVNAFIVESENVQALADKIVYVVNNEQERMNIGESAKETCRRCFDYKAWSGTLKSFLAAL